MGAHLQNYNENTALGMIRHLFWAIGLSLKSREKKDLERCVRKRKVGSRKVRASNNKRYFDNTMQIILMKKERGQRLKKPTWPHGQLSKELRL